MIKTAIIIGFQDNFPIWYKFEGFAQNLNVANWMFDYCGWNNLDKNSQLLICEETINWNEGDKYFPCNGLEVFILGEKRILN
jgi:hypothetical protein